MTAGESQIVGGQPSLRRLNASAVLRALRTDGPRTLRDLATDTGLSRPTVEAAVADLSAGGWVVEMAPEAGGVGRPARRYRFRAEARFVIGVDVGAHKVLAVVTNLEGRVVASHRAAVDPGQGAQERLAVVRTAARRCLAAGRVGRAAVEAAGVAAAGVVDASGTVTVSDVLPGFTGLDLAGEAAHALDCPVVVGNDANLAALAERWRGAATDVDDVVHVLVGRRLGCGILVGGRLHRGHHGAAGEIAHDNLLGLASVIPFDRALLEAAAAGRPDARAAVADFAARLAKYIAALVLAVDPELVVIGGGLAPAAELFLPDLRRHLAETCLVAPRVAASAMGDESVALGAARLALDDAERRLFAA